MQSNGWHSASPQPSGKRRRIQEPAGQPFSTAEHRVLEHAADILGVPIKVLLSLNSPLSEILSENTGLHTDSPIQRVAPTDTTALGPYSLDTTVPASNGDWKTSQPGPVTTGSNPLLSSLTSGPHGPINGFDAHDPINGFGPQEWEGLLQAPLANHDNFLNTNGTARHPALPLSNGRQGFGETSMVWRNTMNGVDNAEIVSAPPLPAFDMPIPGFSLPDNFLNDWPTDAYVFPSQLNRALGNTSEENGMPEDSCEVPPSMKRKRGRGAFATEEEKQQTNKTRQIGACTRCRVQKVRGLIDQDPQRPCLTCVKRTSKVLPNMPCIRLKMVDAALYEKGSHPQFIWTKRWKSMNIMEISEWASPEIKTITVTQEVGGTSYELPVRQFIPQEGDSLERRWCSNGEYKAHRCATYAISNMKATGKTLLKFVHENVAITVAHNVDAADPLLGPAYGMALRLQTTAKNEDERRLLRDMLRLWTAIRMESRSEVIIGEETLGMERQLHDNNYHNYGKYLMPPVISAQIELITTKLILQPLKQRVLQQLQTMITDKKKTHWLTIYLCIFILLHSCALLTEFQKRLAIKWGSGSRYVYADFVSELHNGARTMLIYFHLCNQGVRPFATDGLESFIKTTGLDEEQARFMRATVEIIREKGPSFEEIKKRNQMEDKYYFLCQLYDENWKPV